MLLEEYTTSCKSQSFSGRGIFISFSFFPSCFCYWMRVCFLAFFFFLSLICGTRKYKAPSRSNPRTHFLFSKVLYLKLPKEKKKQEINYDILEYVLLSVALLYWTNKICTVVSILNRGCHFKKISNLPVLGIS